MTESGTQLKAAPANGAPVEGIVKRQGSVITWVASRGIFIFTGVLLVFSVIFVNGFASSVNIIDVFHRASAIGIVAIGMTFVVISANYIDLSVVAQVATAGVILLALSPTYGVLGAMAIALFFALLYGVVNGVSVGFLKANAVVVTLGTTGIGAGILSLLTTGTIYYGPENGPIDAFGDARVGPFPLSAFVLILVAVIASIVLSRSKFGFMIRSYGSNKQATRLAGVNSGGVVVGAFVLTSIAAMIAGFVLAAYSNTAVATMSEGFDFRALAAVIIGGNSLFGGRGSILRTFLGVIFISVLSNILVLSGFSFAWQQLVTGAVIVFAVALDALARKAEKR